MTPASMIIGACLGSPALFEMARQRLSVDHFEGDEAAIWSALVEGANADGTIHLGAIEALLVEENADGVPTMGTLAAMLENARGLDETALMAQIEHIKTAADAPPRPGIARFLRSSRLVGQDDPLDGPQWLIPGILLEGQTAICAGPPGSGKSFALLDWAARIVRDIPFMGKPVLRGGAIYVAGEGQTGFAKRVAALASEFELSEASPFLYMRKMPRLLDRQEVEDFIAAVKMLTASWSHPIRVIAFDTFNRAIVGGSESEGKDVAKLLDADNRIKEAFDCANIFAHHPGKADGNALRGHSSLSGDTDVNVVFGGMSGIRTIEIKKQKDEEDGQVFGYSLRKVELGIHRKSGDAVTTCLVDWIDGETARNVRANKSTWPKGLTLLCDVLATATLESGIDHRPSGDGPLLKAVPLDQVRTLHKKRYVGTGDGDRIEAEGKAFRRNIRAARDARLIAGEVVNGQELVWSTKSP